MSVEHLFRKEELIRFIKDNTKKHNKDLLDVYISKAPITKSKIKDTFGKTIFESLDTNGWMVFVDPCKIANWSHPCEYWFVVDNEQFEFKYGEKWKPSSELEYESITEFLDY
ncbi:hypothetical protein ACOJQI_21065 [Bacillus salacetis]|uniref:hypothetical protein n=1 Tax=Bacillus salacetis TaxID=2315464 RepID=UPI003BA14DE1